METIYNAKNGFYLSYLNKDFRGKVEDLIKYADSVGYDVRINSGHRDYDKTIELYKKEKWSHHQFGLAIDVNLYNKKTGKYLKQASSREEWLSTGIPQYAEKIGLKWGGDIGFTYYDPVHFDYQKKYPIAKLIEKGKELYGNNNKNIMDNGYKIA